VAAILMHGGPHDHRPAPRLWLFSGTGDGPPLASALLARGWRLRVSVVTAEAGRAYPSHPRLELRVGALGGSEPLRRALEQAQGEASPFQVVVDATHPFATAIHGQLQTGCRQASVPLLRLVREGDAGPEPDGGVRWLTGLADLTSLDLVGSRLLLAIGARQLALAVAASPGAVHHARLLPRPEALRLALSAGLAPQHVACLQPLSAGQLRLGSLQGSVEAALVRRWRIDRIVARQSGPPTEALWRGVAAAQGCQLLLVRQPPRLRDQQCGSPTELLAQLAAWWG
jgi:precorrin-6A/cobalt-precorrin-6A reductase